MAAKKSARKSAKKATKTVNRSATTGRFVRNSTVKRHPKKTVKENRQGASSKKSGTKQSGS
jgi:hypothetical protein